MDNNRRSANYDWFKGNNKNAPKTNKDQAKVVWKFTKIFLYLALFVFSMTGCVQIFTISTSNQVGRGFEVYTSEKQIPPHISTFAIKGTETQVDSDSDAPFEDVYSIVFSGTDNVWINQKEDEVLLSSIHTQVEADLQVKMRDAYRGVNEGFRVIADTTFNDDAKNIDLDDQHNKIYQFDDIDKVAVISSVASDGLSGLYRPVSDLDFSTGSANDISIWVVSNIDEDDNNKATYQQISLNVNASPSADDKFQNLRNEYGMSILYEFLVNPRFKPLQDFFATDPTQYQYQKDDDTWINTYALAQKKGISTILAYAGLKENLDDNKYVESYELRENYLPGMEGATSYRPIITWGDAWSLGPFYGLFVWPIGKVAAAMVTGFPLMAGWEALLTILFVVFALRMITFALSFKSTMQQTVVQELQGKKAIIDAKYAPYKGNKQMEMRQKQEVSDLYKKENINPLSSLGTVFLTMPFFLAIWRVIGGIPHLKAAVWLGINFSATSYQEFFNGQLQYVPLMLIAAGVQLLSQLYPRILSKRRSKSRMNTQQQEAMKKANKNQNIVMLVFVLMALIFTAGIQIYWIIGGLWRLIESKITHEFLIRKRRGSMKKGFSKGLSKIRA